VVVAAQEVHLGEGEALQEVGEDLEVEVAAALEATEDGEQAGSAHVVAHPVAVALLQEEGVTEIVLLYHRRYCICPAVMYLLISVKDTCLYS